MEIRVTSNNNGLYIYNTTKYTYIKTSYLFIINMIHLFLSLLIRNGERVNDKLARVPKWWHFFNFVILKNWRKYSQTFGKLVNFTFLKNENNLISKREIPNCFVQKTTTKFVGKPKTLGRGDRVVTFRSVESSVFVRNFCLQRKWRWFHWQMQKRWR